MERLEDFRRDSPPPPPTGGFGSRRAGWTESEWDMYQRRKKAAALPVENDPFLRSNKPAEGMVYDNSQR